MEVMRAIGLSILILSFIGLGNLLMMLMCCDIVESQQFNDSDLYWHATEFVNKHGGPFRLRIFCCWTGLPMTLFMLFVGYVLFKLY